jgi:threonine synthase
MRYPNVRVQGRVPARRRPFPEALQTPHRLQTKRRTVKAARLMKYLSTRGTAPVLDFEAATLAGLARDGGLYLPESWPQLSRDEIADLAGLDYVETAVRVCRGFVGDALTEDELRELLAQAYASFAHPAVTPLVQLDRQHWLLELFHGPTLAFKDVAMQALGLLFEKFLSRRSEHLTIIGATSGDTGSAAIAALAGRANLDIFMLHPEGRVSDVQRRQMTTVMAPNVHNIAVKGNFDDAQALVKAMFNDPSFAGTYRLSAVNSINWARLLLQTVYYFYAAVRLGGPATTVNFAVPTGNFGDVFAGYVASRMGLPIGRLIVATNVNDILARALAQGDYSVGTVAPTAAPSMDIQVSSNFERLLFDLYDRDGARLSTAMAGFESTKALKIPAAALQRAQNWFDSHRVDADEMALTLRWAHAECGQLIDPHTAIGLAAGRALADGMTGPIVTLATAHPAKFRDAVERATGVRASMPARIAGLFDREERYDVLPAELGAVEAFIAERATRA